MKPIIFCLMGPTASGKTQIAVDLAQKYPLEIISVDSSMIYRGMDIGTAKPDKETLKLAPHRLIDMRDPVDPYSVGQFCEDAVREIDAIFEKGKWPLLVGGTMLYFHSLQQGLSELPDGNSSIRESINQEAYQIGWPALHAKLAILDPTSANRIHCNDAQRISRALEIYQITGKPWGDFVEQRKTYLAYPIVNLALWIEDRHTLHKRIEQRFDAMLANGWVEEVERLLRRGDLTATNPSMRSVGYRQIFSYLNGQGNFEEMREQGVIATRQLAKRQMTWIRGFKDVCRIDTTDQQHLQKTLKSVFQEIS